MTNEQKTKKRQLPVVGVEGPTPIYDAQNQLLGHKVTLTYRIEKFYSYPADSEKERMEKTNQAAEDLRDIMSAGYTLRGEAKYDYFPRGLQVVAHFTHEFQFKQRLAVNSYRRAQHFVSKMREIVLHPGRHDGD